MAAETEGNNRAEAPPQYGAFTPGSPDAIVLLTAMRPAFYELAAEVIDAQSQRIFQQRDLRPPLGLIACEMKKDESTDRVVEELHSWEDMKEAFVWTGIRGIATFMRSRHTLSMARRLYRFEKTTRIFRALSRTPEGQPVQEYESAEMLLTGGHVTGASMIVGGLQSVGDVVSESGPASAEKIRDIAAKSHTLVTQPANIARDTFPHVLNAIDIAPKTTLEQLRQSSFTRIDPQLLITSEVRGETHAQYELPFKDHRDIVLQQRIADLQSQFPVIGCPALRNMVIRNYWGWGVDIAYRAGLWGQPAQ